MIEQWQELKETIIELRDNEGTGTQQEVCEFLANLMNMLEKQMKESKTESEEQPCEDCISRQAVLELIDFYDGQNQQHFTVDNLRDDVENVPSVIPKAKIRAEIVQSRWIPVSERLPEEAYGCLVTVLDTNVNTQEEFENILPYFVGYDGETWDDADGEPIPFEVIAWMPLPKPYEPQESEGKHENSN